MGNWIVGILVLLIIGTAARKVYQDKKAGKGCSGCCEGCASKCPRGTNQ